MEIPDGDLVRLARHGDPAAFRLLVERHLPMARARAARLCRQPDDADDYLGRTVTFRGQLRTSGIAGRAGLHLAVGAAYEPPGAHLRDRGASSLTGPGSSDWTWHEVTMPVGDAGVIRFGISLTGRGRIELRNPELSAARPGTPE